MLDQGSLMAYKGDDGADGFPLHLRKKGDHDLAHRVVALVTKKTAKRSSKAVWSPTTNPLIIGRTLY